MKQRYDVRKVCSHANKSKCPCPYYFLYGRTWRFTVDVQAGKHIELLSEARALGDRWREEIDKGIFVRRGRGQDAPVGSPAARTGLTLTAFSEIYLRDCSMLAKAGVDMKDKQHADYYVFQPLLAFTLPDGRQLGSLPFAAVDETMYELHVAARRQQGYAASTVNKDVQLITAMCRWATRRGYFGPQKINPISGESRILVRKDPARRQRRITDEELQALRPHTDPLLWAFIELALITCLRLTELYRLRWSDHHGMRLKVRPEATKVASAERWAPLDDRGVAILAYLRVDPAGRPYPDGDFIFGQYSEPPVDINDRFNTALLKAFPGAEAIDWVKGVHGPAARQRLEEIDILFGDLRHEGALRKYDNNWQLNELQVLLGHSNLVQTSTYLGIGSEAVARAMAQHGSGAKVLGVASTTSPDYQQLPVRGGKPGPKGGSKSQVTH